MSLILLNSNHIRSFYGDIIFNPNNLIKPTLDTRICFDNVNIPADIYCQIEPEVILPVQNYLINNYKKYKYIITYNSELLEKCPNAKLMLYGTTWISLNQSINLPNKKYLLTTLVGNKIWTESQKFRHVLYNLQEFISIPKIFYRSENVLNILKDYGNNPILPDNNKYNMLKESQFHLTIENCSVKNYFSEKLCDALMTKNIPIYYGCTNIDQYFDTTGWIILESTDPSEFLVKIKNINDKYYDKYIDIVNKNFEKVKEYIDLNYMLNNVLKTITDY